MSSPLEDKRLSYAEPRLLRLARVSSRSRALFRGMHADPLLREQFVTDPVQVLSDYVYDWKVGPSDASIANRLVYSVLSSRTMLRWLVEYSREAGHRSVSRAGFLEHFGRAVAESGDFRIVFALLASSLTIERSGAIEAFESFVFALLQVFNDGMGRFGTAAASGDTSGDTGGNTGGGDTGGSTGGDTGGSTGGDTGGGDTGGSTGGDTGGSTGGIFGGDVAGDFGGVVDPYLPGYAQITIEQLIEYASELVSLGALEEITDTPLS